MAGAFGPGPAPDSSGGRTLADLDGERDIARNHLMEALGYRQLDRQQNQGPVVSPGVSPVREQVWRGVC